MAHCCGRARAPCIPGSPVCSEVAQENWLSSGSHTVIWEHRTPFPWPPAPQPQQALPSPRSCSALSSPRVQGGGGWSRRRLQGATLQANKQSKPLALIGFGEADTVYINGNCILCAF